MREPVGAHVQHRHGAGRLYTSLRRGIKTEEAPQQRSEEGELPGEIEVHRRTASEREEEAQEVPPKRHGGHNWSQKKKMHKSH